MAQIVDCMVRAAKLDPTLYAEVSRDKDTMGEAITIGLIGGALAGLMIMLPS